MPLSGISVVLLAGGQGARLGGLIKPLLRTADGRTLLELALQCYRPLGVPLVIAPLGLHPVLRSAVPTVQLFADPGEGPAVALQSALPHCLGPRLLLAAADHPAPSWALVERLAQAAETFDGAICVADGRDQPMPGIYQRAALVSSAEGGAEAELRRSLRALLAPLHLARLEAAQLDPEERAALGDVDTPEDLLRSGLHPGV